MVASGSGETDGGGFPPAVSRVPGARHNSTELARPVVEHFCRGCGAWCSWLVDGVLRTHARRKCLAIPSGISPYARHRDLWGNRLDRAATAAVGVNRGAGAPTLCCLGDSVSAAVSDL